MIKLSDDIIKKSVFELSKNDVIKNFGEILIFQRIKNGKKTFIGLDSSNTQRTIMINQFDMNRKYNVIGFYED